MKTQKTYDPACVEDVLGSVDIVIENWESGDLASAVNNLQDSAACCRESAKRPKVKLPRFAVIVEGGVVQEVISETPAEYVLIDHENLEEGGELDFTPIACDVQDLDSVVADVRAQYSCKECGKPNNDGEGWDGLCGNCADKAERKAKP
jgi:hypothetical protein